MVNQKEYYDLYYKELEIQKNKEKKRVSKEINKIIRWAKWKRLLYKINC